MHAHLCVKIDNIGDELSSRNETPLRGMRKASDARLQLEVNCARAKFHIRVFEAERAGVYGVAVDAAFAVALVQLRHVLGQEDHDLLVESAQ